MASVELSPELLRCNHWFARIALILGFLTFWTAESDINNFYEEGVIEIAPYPCIDEKFHWKFNFVAI